MAQPSILLALRASTAAAHARLEGELDLYARIGDRAQRRAMVARFFRLHHGAEAQVAPWLEDMPDLDFADRIRSPLILRDLRSLGGAQPPETPAPAIRSRGAALGWMYVLEGNSLGGRVIHRALTGRGEDLVGLAFLYPYGPDTGERWRSFIAVLDHAQASGEAATADIIDGAVAAFDHSLRTLCGPDVSRRPGAA